MINFLSSSLNSLFDIYPNLPKTNPESIVANLDNLTNELCFNPFIKFAGSKTVRPFISDASSNLLEMNSA
ncbi:MAG: hypothetical protein U5N85_23140 [Arcicella sp.]|nr:hypothetical protein [Arcicella sp.]